MNYLAHVIFGLPDVHLVAGSFLADHIKGDVSKLPERFRAGVILHRKIDSFVDDHPIVFQSKQLISKSYRRYAGILVDIFYDYFLTKHWTKYTNFPFGEVSLFTSMAVNNYSELIPSTFMTAVKRLEKIHWLEAYGSVEGVRSSIARVSSRGRRKHLLEDADLELIKSYDLFEKHFLECMPLICTYANSVKIELYNCYSNNENMNH